MLVVGEKEAENDSVAVRVRGLRDIETVGVEKFIGKIREEIKEKK